MLKGSVFCEKILKDKSFLQCMLWMMSVVMEEFLMFLRRQEISPAPLT